jgi:pyruvate dehydrogenase E2 component (dihydrolipoamide acetyltransferase)
MAIQVLMPALSPTMTEGNLAKWHKKEGDTVSAGDVIAEIETDKATMEVEAVDEGILGKILIAEGSQGVKVNEVIAVLVGEGEKYEANGASQKAQAAEQPKTVTAANAPDAQASAPQSLTLTPVAGNRPFASPLARRIAEQNNIDLSAIKGSGPNGRIVKADVENVKATGGKSPSAAKKSTDNFSLMPDAELTPHTMMRKVIAKRLTESKQQVPHFYLNMDIELDALLALRKQLNARDEKLKLSVNDFIIRACALALVEVPAANASWSDEGVHQYAWPDISVAVAIDGGLITPIIRAAHNKRLPTLSSEMKDLASRARAGKLKPEEFQGGTFSLSNLGMFGVKNFNAIINPPQGCILAVGAGEERPVVKNGSLAIATVMTVTLSVDHRVVDGAVGAQFLGAFKKLLEDPLALVL